MGCGSVCGQYKSQYPKLLDDYADRPPEFCRKNSTCSVSSEMTLAQVAAGHGGASILKCVSKQDSDPDRPRFVMKEFDEREVAVYNELATTDDQLRPFVAEFHGEVEEEDIPEDLEGTRYMKLTNLLRDFGTHPHVMDCKLGVRTFLETEILNKKMRKDLYIKMKAMDEHAPTEEEHQAQACTKHRWMSFNDGVTTTSRFGVRIDGIANSKGSAPKSTLKLLRNVVEMSNCIVEHFFLGHDQQDGSAAAGSMIAKLQDIREALVLSGFASRHSFVGASLLFIVEQRGPSAGVYLIDFAKTFPLPDGVHIDHISPWAPGNHEDGVLIGLDNLILCWEQVRALFDIVPEILS